MAYFTELSTARELTAGESASLTNYVTAQTTAGTTDGNRYLWPIFNSEQGQSVRMWGTIESANGYKAVAAGFTPPVDVKVF